LIEDPKLNPKLALGAKAIPLHLVPAAFLMAAATGLQNGKYKYGGCNYRVAKVSAVTYIDALLRHAQAFKEGEYLDPEDGVPHFSGMCASLAILVDAWFNGNIVDDRPYPSDYRAAYNHFKPHIARLEKMHKDAGKDPKHWTILDAQGEVLSEGENT
jgi:hypothetical protein